MATTASAAALARNISIEDAHDCFGYTLGLQWWVVVVMVGRGRLPSIL